MSDRIFIAGGIENELMKNMETSLIQRQKNKLYDQEKINKALDMLSSAAELFDSTGFNKEAELVVKTIEKIADSEHINKLIEEEIGPNYNKMDKMIHEELAKQEIDEILNSDKKKL